MAEALLVSQRLSGQCDGKACPDTVHASPGSAAKKFDGLFDRGEAPKGFTGGTHRLVPPEETLTRVMRYMPAMGITRIANVTGLDRIGVPVVMVCRPNSSSLSVFQGKGVGLAEAKASGLMEAVETYHAERIALPLRLGCVEDLRYTYPVVDVGRLPQLAESRFTAFTPLLWIEGHDLVRNSPRWVPYEMVHLCYTLPLPTGHGCFPASSNGLASGNHLLEAVSHGICEVVERDAMTLWHMADAQTQADTRLDLASINDTHCREVIDKFKAAGVLVAVWETTSDVGIPTFLCRILESRAPPATTCRPASGMGCHPSREIALLRALTEAAQSRLTFISGSRDDLHHAGYERFLCTRKHEEWRARIETEAPHRDFRNIPTWRGSSFDEDVTWEIEQLRAVGIDEVTVVDLTKPEFGIPVVRVIVPGLEGINDSPKFVPGVRARRLVEAAAR